MVTKGHAYTFNRSKKMCTHPVFYVGLPKPYQDPDQVSVEALGPVRHVVAEQREAGLQQVAGPQLSDLTLQVCDPVQTHLWKLRDLPLQVHNLVVNRLRGLDPVHPQLQFIEIYRLAVNVVVRVADTRVDRAKSYSRGNRAL
ncbi:hypothetical protein PI124_g19040 [Phytophthora idaei]|nr:hypothetical protein PI124_g19040 [Phytophthora idaei]